MWSRKKGKESKRFRKPRRLGHLCESAAECKSLRIAQIARAEIIVQILKTEGVKKLHYQRGQTCQNKTTSHLITFLLRYGFLVSIGILSLSAT
jgi:hypothetical protein